LANHQRKLYNLWREQRICSPNCIINLSNKILSIKEEEVLRFGLQHHIFRKKVELDSLKVYLERLFSIIKRKANIPAVNDETKDQIKYLF